MLPSHVSSINSPFAFSPRMELTLCGWAARAYILTPRIQYFYSVTEKQDVMVLAPVMVLAGPKGRQLEVGPVGPIDF